MAQETPVRFISLGGTHYNVNKIETIEDVYDYYQTSRRKHTLVTMESGNQHISNRPAAEFLNIINTPD